MRRQVKTSGPASLDWQVTTAPEALEVMQREWGDLWRRAQQPYFSQSFDWCKLAWDSLAQARGRKLLLVSYRHAGRLDFIWPLVTYELKGFRLIRPLGPEGSEYALPLCNPGIDVERVSNQVIEAIRRDRNVDIIRLPFLLKSQAINQNLLERRFRFDETLTASSVDWASVQDWSSYFRNRVSSKHRKNHERLRRLLATGGRLQFRLIDDIAERQEKFDWLMQTKLAWMKTTGHSNAWLIQAGYRDFLRHLLSCDTHMGRLAIVDLELDGKIVSGLLVALTGSRMEVLITAFDPAFAKYSPGQLLWEDALRFAYERKLEFDLRIGDDPYKKAWCNQYGEVVCSDIAVSLRGALFVLARKAQATLRGLRPQNRR
ncbi:hypothetical protein MMA231_04108 (plasmid) [Asticcacaulis sp. MM231]|uniref:GNAT family N-acetyltransferase n=1 Tax=Asticcacaulis sp. MM231 TaxID=3157666 RepID=UPI0032D57242